VVLADGSKVWLNAESSITFPTAFIGKERNVEIKGEAYFEVAHNAQMPFNVKVKNMTVQVLGTHFNVNAYDDENWIKTTLLEGSIKVSKGSDSKIIKPGEQAQTENGDNSLIAVQAVDPDEVVAWKNGLFHFNNAGLPEVMHQLSRWYDVDVVYNGPVPKRKFGGEMQSNLKLSQVLELLEKNEVNFKIEGKKIIVMP
jgi:ferric-dicitrate binding protein FerR (iron transport regulator)